MVYLCTYPFSQLASPPSHIVLTALSATHPMILFLTFTTVPFYHHRFFSIPPDFLRNKRVQYNGLIYIYIVKRVLQTNLFIHHITHSVCVCVCVCACVHTGAHLLRTLKVSDSKVSQTQFKMVHSLNYT